MRVFEYTSSIEFRSADVCIHLTPCLEFATEYRQKVLTVNEGAFDLQPVLSKCQVYTEISLEVISLI